MAQTARSQIDSSQSDGPSTGSPEETSGAQKEDEPRDLRCQTAIVDVCEQETFKTICNKFTNGPCDIRRVPISSRTSLTASHFGGREEAGDGRFFCDAFECLSKNFFEENGQLRLTHFLHFAILRDPPATARLTESPARR
ncbi:hypothetical protein CEE69_06170 [Rhodopirellula bahusiensis]|uniref:Uncharacterized protein n=1 Tax=Rhodopirellula bahusiensis TaxID=2014065 RepID=A0A2G1WC75_9BACT|nr:hypothetical protein CEE69_06170 [Rhodopirellula bahusiensis]